MLRGVHYAPEYASIVGVGQSTGYHGVSRARGGAAAVPTQERGGEGAHPLLEGRALDAEGRENAVAASSHATSTGDRQHACCQNRAGRHQ